MKHILYALNGTFLMLLVPALFVLALRQLSHEANQKLVNTFGFNSQIIVGGLGIIVHELSHVIYKNHNKDFYDVEKASLQKKISTNYIL